MFLRKTAEHLRAQNWGAVVLDLVIVVLGIFLAFQLDRWYEGKLDEKLERTYLARLGEEFRDEASLFAQAEDRAARRAATASHVEQCVADPSLAAADPQAFALALEKAGWTSAPEISAFVYRELQSSGRFTLIRSDELRRAITDHYGWLDREQHLLSDRHLQLAYEEHTLGLLSSEELATIEEAEGRPDDLGVSAERATGLARELQQRRQAIVLLPELIQHHLFNRRQMQRARLRAEALASQIDELLQGASG